LSANALHGSRVNQRHVTAHRYTTLKEWQLFDAVWVVSKHDRVNFEVAMYRIVPGILVSRFAITLDSEDGKTTSASVSYEQTALDKEGEKIVNEFTAESFADFMDKFTLAINHYLTTGKMIDGNALMM
jgi:hypothetical protein